MRIGLESENEMLVLFDVFAYGSYIIYRSACQSIDVYRFSECLHQAPLLVTEANTGDMASKKVLRVNILTQVRLQCQICLQVLLEPRTLRCCHNIC